MNTYKVRFEVIVVLLLTIHVTGCAPREPRPREWQADLPYSFTNAPYISPMILADLTSWLSDTDDQVVAIDLLGAQGSTGPAERAREVESAEETTSPDRLDVPSRDESGTLDPLVDETPF